MIILERDSAPVATLIEYGTSLLQFGSDWIHWYVDSMADVKTQAAFIKALFQLHPDNRFLEYRYNQTMA